MKRINMHLIIAALIFGLILSLSITISASSLVYLLPIEGEIEPGLAAFIARGIQLAQSKGGIVLLEINTFGGRVDAATEIKDLIFKADVPVIAYVSERAWSAGALITLAAPQIAMAPGSSVGAAEPRPMEEKTVSALRAEFESTAERWNRNPKIAGAMVDADIVIEDLVEQGKILTLSATDALKWGMTDFLVQGHHQLLSELGYKNYEIIQLSPHIAERIARFLTNSTVSSLLLTLGFLGLIFEITSPGWGVPGTVGMLSLILFFGGRFVTGFIGLEAILLFIIGVVLLVLEVAVIPGFGVAGILGIASVLGSIILAFGDPRVALLSLSIAIFLSIVLVILLWGRIRQSRLWRRLILSHQESSEAGYLAPARFDHLIGKRGLAITPLRPAGTVLIEEERYDVVSEGGFVLVNSQVEVVEVEGTRVIVRELKED